MLLFSTIYPTDFGIFMTLKQLFSTIYPTDFGIFVSAVDELVVA